MNSSVQRVLRLGAALALSALVVTMTGVATAQESDLSYDEVSNTWLFADSAIQPEKVEIASPEPTQPVNAKGTMLVVSSFPFPSGWSFARDMAWDGSSLWVAESLSSRIYEMDPVTGTELSSIFPFTANPRGLAFDGTNLINAEKDSAGGSEPDDATVMSTTGVFVTSWALPNSPNSEAHGCAYDTVTGNLWLADSAAATIYELNPASGAVVSTFAAPGSDVHGLAFAGGDLWGIDLATLTLIRFSTTGVVIDTFDISSLGTIPEGLACDGQYMWLSENSTNTIYQIDVGPVPVELMELAVE